MIKKYEYICKTCEKSEWMPRWQHRKKKYPALCKSCAKKLGTAKYKNIKNTDPERWVEITKIKSDSASKRHKKSTPGEKTKHALKMRALVKISGTELRRRQQTYIDNAGDEYYKKYCEKRKQIALDFHKNLTPQQKEKHYRKVLKTNGRSKECASFIQVLKEHDINCIEEQYINGFIVDAIIQNTNIVIEYYGDMFHCNPKKFKDPTQICSWIGGRTVQEQWDRDRRRLAALYKYGFVVIIVWGIDWKSNQNSIIRKIQNEMRKSGKN